MARASRAPSVSVWTPRGEHRRKAFTLRHPHHRPSFYSCIRTVYCMLYRFSAGISYYCYLFTFLLVYIVLILDCVGYFHRPKKPLIQSRYTHISECFLLARLRRRINAVQALWECMLTSYNALDKPVTDEFFICGVTVSSFYMGLKPNFNTTSTTYPGMCVPSFVHLLLDVAKILRGRKWGQKYAPSALWAREPV